MTIVTKEDLDIVGEWERLYDIPEFNPFIPAKIINKFSVTGNVIGTKTKSGVDYAEVIVHFEYLEPIYNSLLDPKTLDRVKKDIGMILDLPYITKTDYTEDMVDVYFLVPIDDKKFQKSINHLVQEALKEEAEYQEENNAKELEFKQREKAQEDEAIKKALAIFQQRGYVVTVEDVTSGFGRTIKYNFS